MASQIFGVSLMVVVFGVMIAMMLQSLSFISVIKICVTSLVGTGIIVLGAYLA